MRPLSSVALAVLVTCAAVPSFSQPTPAAPATERSAAAVCEWPELQAAWSGPGRSVAGVWQRDAADLASEVGQALRVRLEPCAFDWCKPGSHAAMVKVNVPRDARYRVAIDQMAWIDVYTATEKLEGVMCEHSGCQPIRKILQYDLKAGHHWVSVQGRSPSEIGVLVIGVGH
jgi:hypothetical protein